MEALSAEVAIVGGSLAGGAAALALARAGRSAVVLEKARFPRPRICGELLSARAEEELDRAGLLSKVLDAGAERITHFSLVRADGRRVEGRLPRGALSLSRPRLDTLVALAAEEAGGRFVFGEPVTSIAGDLASGFAVEGPGVAVRARAVVGAWGRFSPLDGRLGRPFFRRSPALFGFEKHLAGDGARLSGRVVLHLFRGGYLGLTLVEGGQVNLAALATTEIAREAHGSFDELLERLKRESSALAEDLRGLAPGPGPVLLSEPVHLVPKEAWATGVMLAGDAAGLVDPWTGRGIGKALASGRLAGEALVAWLEGALGDTPLAARHVREERRLARGDLVRSRLIRPIFSGGAAAAIVRPAASPLARLLVRWVAA